MKRIIQSVVFLISLLTYSFDLSASSRGLESCRELVDPQIWSRAKLHPALDGVCPRRVTPNSHIVKYCKFSYENTALSFHQTMLSFGKLCERRKLSFVEIDYFWQLAKGQTLPFVNPGYHENHFGNILRRVREDVAVESNKIGRICFKNRSKIAMDELKECEYLDSLNYPFI